MSSPQDLRTAEDFRRARRQAAVRQVMARLTGRSTELLSFDDVCQKLKLEGSASRGASGNSFGSHYWQLSVVIRTFPVASCLCKITIKPAGPM